jgi:putative nucleotidyltransferase-like protein
VVQVVTPAETMNPYNELTGWLRGDVTTPLSQAALDEARHHAMHLVVAERGHVADDQLVREVRAAVIVEAARTEELRRIAGALGAARVRTLWFKGAALAYSIYPRPDVRPSADSDLLIQLSDRELVLGLFTRLGYEPEAKITGDLIMAQRCVTRRNGPLTHAIDIHWKLVNPLRYADVLTFDDLWPISVNLPALSQAARMPSLADHLVISCLHRVAHHQNTSHLLWLYDIHLLVRSLDEQQRQSAIMRARACNLNAVCHLGLTMAHEAFGGVDSSFLEAFNRQDAGDPIARAFLSPESNQMELVRQDWRELKGVGPRLRLVRQHLFPPAAYIRSIYPRVPAPLLPLAYALRVLRGAPRWFAPRA